MPILEKETSLHPLTLLSELLAEHIPSASTEQPDDESDNSRCWWAVYTKARQEKAFARQLLGMDISFYLPLVPKANLIRGRKVESHIPLFGGYVFLFANEAERVKSLTTNRISTILEVVDQRQLTYDLNQVETLIQMNAPLTVESRLAPGDLVRIKNGPMQGLEGTVITRRGKARLLVAVTMLQQGVSVEIDDFVLEPIG